MRPTRFPRPPRRFRSDSGVRATVARTNPAPLTWWPCADGACLACQDGDPRFVCASAWVVPARAEVS